MLKKFAVLLVLLGLTAPVAALGGPPTPEILRQRQQLARSHRFLVSQGTPLTRATAESLASALDVDPGLIANASIDGPGSASATLNNLGVIQPLRGATFALLSSGTAGASQPEPGTDFAPGGVSGDSTSLSLTLNVPSGTGRLSFAFAFLSTEFPEFVNAGFNDTFSAVLQDADGNRQVAGANVDSTTFFPASVGEAAGSGFDLFTADPSGVDSSFGSTGSSDAGLTRFVWINAPYRSSGQVTVTFSITDSGDGILDSAVLLDGLSASSLEVVDVIPDLFRGGSFVTDPGELAVRGEARQGAAADGVTRVLARARVNGPGDVTFSLDGGTAPQDGGFDQVGGNGRNGSVTVSAVQTSAGYEAFALYRTPDEFNRGGDTNARDRTVTFLSRFVPTGGGSAVESRFTFKLVRPPLVFLHGLWADPGTWKFPLVRDSRFPSIRLADYRSTFARSFATNSQVARVWIHTAVDDLRRQRIASTQADVVGHSMGGILGRIWTTSGDYKRDDNLRAGDIRKLFTLDTPHTGSPLANLLDNLRHDFLLGDLAVRFFRRIEHPIDEGAIEDLAKGSPAIGGIAPAPVPAHVFVGIGGSDALEEAPGRLGQFYTLVNFFAAVTGNELFESLQHDFVVGRLSQAGGLPTGAQTVIGGGDGIHFGVPFLAPGNTGSTIYSSELSQLIDTSIGSGQFAQLPAPASLLSAQETRRLQALVSARIRPIRSVSPGLTITSPAPGTEVSPGAVITVAVQPNPGVSVESVLVAGPSAVAVDNAAPFEVQLQIPIESIGDFTIEALGRNSQGQMFTSNTVLLNVRTKSTLNSIEILPRDPLLLGPGDSTGLTVIGTYSDGVTRNLGSAGAGTTFSSVEPEIATVSPDGVITAVTSGFTTILARNGDVQDSVTVTILGGGVSPTEIPTLSQWGLAALLALLALIAIVRLRSRKADKVA